MARISKYLKNSTNRYNVALYVRLSNEDKNNQISESVKSQKALLEDFVKKLPNIQSYNFYIDDGYSGGNFDRPSFKQMIEDIISKKINCVIVKDLSRFGRNYIELSNYVQIMFPSLETRFISINDNLDSETSSQEFDTLFIGLTGLMSEEYLKDCSIKSKISYSLRQNNGLFTSPVAPYGYLRDVNDIHKLVVDEKVSHIVKYIFESYIAKKSFRAVAEDLTLLGVLSPSEYKQNQNANYYTNRRTILKHVWNPDTVATILRNQVYIGNMVQHKREIIDYKTKNCKRLDKSKWRIIENTHTPIISVELFNSVQNLISIKNSSFKKKTTTSNSNNNYFKGLVYCGKCGSKMTYVSEKNSKNSFYKCKLKGISKHICNSFNIKADDLSKVVLTILNKYINIACNLVECITKIEKKPDSSNYNKEHVKNSINLLQKQKDNLYQKYSNCEISISEYKAQKAELDNELLKMDTTNILEKPKINSTLEGLIKYENIKTLTKEIVSTFISSIIVHSPDNVEINFKFKDEFNYAMEYVKNLKH